MCLPLKPIEEMITEWTWEDGQRKKEKKPREKQETLGEEERERERSAEEQRRVYVK